MPSDGSDGESKGGILSHSKAPVAKRKKQGDDNVILWVGIVHQTFIKPFEVDERIKLLWF